MHRQPRIPMVLTAVAATAALLATSGTAAEAKGDRGLVRATGSCAGSADWKLKAKLDDGRVEVEFEVDSNRAGQKWRVTIADNGDTVRTVTRRTAGRSGSFSEERRITNLPGDDRITASARNRATGERCSGVVVFSA